MLELGKKSEILHKNLSKVINNSDIDKVFIKGIKHLLLIRILINISEEIFFNKRRCGFYFKKYYS